jgi:alpha-galactosidase
VLSPEISLQPGQSYTTPSTFVAAHSGDYYDALSVWAKVIQRQSNLSIAKPVEGSYEANWCGWGYESDFTPQQMLDVIPKLHQLGFKWATLDLRWFDNYGDWMPREDTFPGNTLRNLVDRYHKEGFRLQAWYQPLSAEDGVGKHSLPKPMAVSRIIKEHPEWAILDKDGKNARMISPVSTGAALCPAVPEVQQYHKQLVERFFRDFDFDGLKMDAVLTVPPCYNPAHHHKSPEDSIRAMGQVYKLIHDTARQIKPYSILQICPCGMAPALAWVFFQDQAVTADPVGSVQVRRRVKMYKALLGPDSAVYGDHVELSGPRRTPGGGGGGETGSDFASSVGTGAVIGTKFTWPGDPPRLRPGRASIKLTPEREAYWKKWIDIYNAKRLSNGTFRNLYVYGYNNPEAYVVEKDGKMYYAFYAVQQPEWKGQVELRGLRPGKYKVFDYVNGRDLGMIDAHDAKLNVEFKDNLLVEVTKI